MTFKNIFRIVILKTNPYWPFTVVNRVPYWLAIKWFVKTCRNFTEVRSVYLRHALVDGHWTPALSDIDLTVIIDGQLSRETEFLFLMVFWRRINRLQKIFPMLGEIEVLGEDHLDSWIKFGIEGRECSNWQLLAGEESVTRTYIPKPGRFSLEAFDCAFWFYLQQITDLYLRPSASKYLCLQDLLRVQRKIGRCLATIGVSKSDALEERDRNPDGADVLLTVLEMLGTGLTCLDIQERSVQTVELRKNWLMGQARKWNPITLPAKDLRGFAHWSNLVRAIHMDNREKAYVILRNCDDSTDNRRCIGEIRRYFIQQKTTAVILTEDLFAYYVRYLKPYDYPCFLEYSYLMFGEDCLVSISLPKQTALEHELLKETPLLLMFPQSQDFIQPGLRGDFSPYDLEYKFDRALALKLFLDRGFVKPSISEMLREYDVVNPHQATEIQNLRKSMKQDQSSKELFVFFKEVLDDVHSALAADDCWENSIESVLAAS